MSSAEETKTYTSNQHPLRSASTRPVAREVESLKTVSSEDYRTIQEEYDQRQSENHTWSNRTLLVVLGVSLVLIVIGGWFRTLGVISFAYAAYELVKRSGERGGYLEGFNKGLDEGVNRGLRLFNTKAPETVVATQSETEANSPS